MNNWTPDPFEMVAGAIAGALLFTVFILSNLLGRVILWIL
jgi:hypothetical protein